MKKQQFKTNVKCAACVETISPEMNKLHAETWKVDLNSPERILTVEGDLDQESIVEALRKSGYQGEKL